MLGLDKISQDEINKKHNHSIGVNIFFKMVFWRSIFSKTYISKL